MKALVLLSACALAVVGGVGVMGIDYGTEWFKVSLVKPRIPLDMVLNRESKRKTEAAVAIRGDVRHFGSDAATLGLRYPRDNYARLKALLGRRFDDPLAAEYRALFDNDMVADERGTCAFMHDGSPLLVEELVAFQLGHARQQCHQYAEEAVNDAIITVPPFWTHHERRALLDAAELAGLRVLSLINDETAVAINYAMLRQKEFTDVPQYHVFYDMGAGSTVASVVAFYTVQEKDGYRWSKNVSVLEVKAVGYDRTLGGQAFDQRLQKLLANQFHDSVGKKKKVDVFSSQRAMAKLLREANRVKHILSANADTGASVEGLIDEIDFRTKVTRAEFEQVTTDLVERIGGPIKKALESAKIKIEDVKSFVLVGGGVRVPAVQAKLQTIVGEDRIAKHVNADEAAVFGAGFYGAMLTPSFRTLEIRVKDTFPYPIVASYMSEAKTEQEPRLKSQKLFSAFSPTNSKKRMTFPRSSDFDFELSYDADIVKAEHLPSQSILNVSVTGITDKLKELQDMKDFKVKVTIDLTDSGILTVPEATLDVTFNKNETKSIGDAIKDSVLSFFGGSSDGENATETKDGEKANNGTDGKNATVAKNSTETKPEGPLTESFPLKISVQPLGIFPVLPEQKKIINERATKWTKQDKQRQRREEARNNLESAVYSIQDNLQKDSIIAASVAEDRDKLNALIVAASEWLYGDGDSPSTATEVFEGKLKELKKLYDPMVQRRDEFEALPDAISKFKTAIASADIFVTNITTGRNESEPLLYEQSDIDKLVEKIAEAKKFLTDSQEKLKTAPKTSMPPVLSRDVALQTQLLNAEVMVLGRKKRKITTAATPTPTPTVIPESTEIPSDAEKVTPDPEAETPEAMSDEEVVATAEHDEL